MEKLEFYGYTGITRLYRLSRFNFDENFKYLILTTGSQKGYYTRGDFTLEDKKSYDYHLFLVVKKTAPCFQDIITRESIKLLQKCECDFYLNPGTLLYENLPTPVIRLSPKGLKYLDEIVEALKENNIELVKDKKKEPFESVTYFKKYKELQELNENIYKDNNVKSLYYVRIPCNMPFEKFDKMMKSVQHTIKFNMFDYFHVQLFKKDRILAFAGIYSNNWELDRFEEFRDEIRKRCGK